MFSENFPCLWGSCFQDTIHCEAAVYNRGIERFALHFLAHKAEAS